MAKYNKPVFLSEFGCNLVSPRPFTEVDAIYSEPMTDVWSGGVAYEWTQEDNNYGLVKVSNSSVVDLLPDYTNLQSQLAKVDPQGVHMDAFTAVRSSPACPSHSTNWKASLTLPPTPSEKACACMRNSVSCVASDKVSLVDSNGKSMVGAQLDIMCGMTSCAEITGDGTTGKYGAFSFCDPKDKLTWLYQSYSQNNLGACDFEGNALKVIPRRKQSVEGCSDQGASFTTGDEVDGVTTGDDSTTGKHGAKSGADSGYRISYSLHSLLYLLLLSFFSH